MSRLPLGGRPAVAWAVSALAFAGSACASAPETMELTVPSVTLDTRSDSSGVALVAIRNEGARPLIVGLELRAAPGMWLDPVVQTLRLAYVPPGERLMLEEPYVFARLSPEATLRVRVGAAEEHPEGWIQLPVPAAVREFPHAASDRGRFLQDFEVTRTEHLTVYARLGIMDHEELQAIAEERERAIRRMAELLAVEPPSGIRLVFYPDAATKTHDTGHVGAGYASGQTIVEIRNDSVRLDPYHELFHMVGGQVGWAPSWLSEGLAVWVSQELGADALAELGGAGKTVEEVACNALRAGEAFELDELFRSPDIAARRPDIAYAEVASFVGYLVDAHGWAAMRQGYRTISAGRSHEENGASFQVAFGVTAPDASDDWRTSSLAACR